MVRRSVRLAKPEDRPQVQAFHDLDTAAVSAKSQKLEEATRARKRQRVEHGESTSSADTMIKDAMARSDNLRDGHEPTLYRGSQLNAQLSKDDPRNEIVERNSLQSPLLSLPAEVRCIIFEYALGHQHVHILTDDYDPDVSVDLPGPARFGAELRATSQTVSSARARRFHNCVFPIDWQSSYRFRQYKSRPYTRGPPWILRDEAERVITATKDRMTLLQVVCRQIYHETRFIPYELNEFSFQDEMTMKDWFRERAAAQKRAINTMWFDHEWERSHTVVPVSGSHHRGARAYIGRSHGIQKVYVSVGAVQHRWVTERAEYRDYCLGVVKGRVYSLLSRKEGETEVEIVK